MLQRHDSGVEDDPVHEPRFPYKPWKQRLPRSYNKVGNTADMYLGISDKYIKQYLYKCDMRVKFSFIFNSLFCSIACNIIFLQFVHAGLGQ